jgi:hypothetical protein
MEKNRFHCALQAVFGRPNWGLAESSRVERGEGIDPRRWAAAVGRIPASRRRGGAGSGQEGRRWGRDTVLVVGAGSSSPEAASHGGVVKAEGLAGARPEERWVAPVVGMESTGASWRSLWTVRRHWTAAGAD